MIVGLKRCIPYAIHTLPKVQINGKLRAKKMEDNIKQLSDTIFVVCVTVTDSQSTNVTAFLIF